MGASATDPAAPTHSSGSYRIYSYKSTVTYADGTEAELVAYYVVCMERTNFELKLAEDDAENISIPYDYDLGKHNLPEISSLIEEGPCPRRARTR